MRLTKRIKVIQGWDFATRQRVCEELIKIVNRPLPETTVKCSAKACQVVEAGAQFDSLGEPEIRALLAV